MSEIKPTDDVSQLPLINCHTHIFTSDYVPPHLAKTFVPRFLLPLLNVTKLVRIAQWWFTSNKSPYKWPYQRWYKLLQQSLYKARIAGSRYYLVTILKFLVGTIIAVSAFHQLYISLLRDRLTDYPLLVSWGDQLITWLEQAGILIITDSWFLKAVLLILLLTFFPSGRNLLFFILKHTVKFFRMLPGKNTFELITRYVNILKFARYKNQSLILARLRRQYPPQSGMVVLPMDMEFMGAGQPKSNYATQMAELAIIKKNHGKYVFPFVFVDPRRTHVGNEIFFDYDIQNGSVILKPCFIQKYIEELGFSGFKIYPALGYFPFDEKLLPLWKYAADNKIPILTHCILGTIYYRGRKKHDWDTHPVFKQYEGNQNDKPLNPAYIKDLRLPQMKPIDVQEIFTHPLNYACLLKKEWLTDVVAKAKDSRIQTLFGFNKETHTIEHDLSHLKICFGHFGGDEMWVKYMEKDRDNWAHQLNEYPDRGIEFTKIDSAGLNGQLRAEQLWKYADWYSLICSLMLQHENVYADISYILHSNHEILPLLKQTLCNEKLKQKVLFGTDFYVVRNHKSDKHMLADMMCGLSKEEFDQIARINPHRFLNI